MLQELACGKPPLARMHPMRVLMDTMHKPPPQLTDGRDGHYSRVRRTCVCAGGVRRCVALAWGRQTAMAGPAVTTVQQPRRHPLSLSHTHTHTHT
jgi:hypothetical protein